MKSMLLVLTLLLTIPPSARAGMKVYISADMEGVAGVVTGDQLGPQGFEYERFRGFMTNEVLAAIAGAKAAGATEFVVSDSHGNGENLLIEKFAKDVQIVRAWPRPLAMMEGIDETFAAAIFIGYHASTTNPTGVRAHTMSSATLADVRLNGVSVPEAGLNAAVAGRFAVPVVMISGDDAIVKEAKALLGDLRFKNYRPAELVAYLPGVERTDAHSVRFCAKSIAEVTQLLEFLTNYEPGLSP